MALNFCKTFFTLKSNIFYVNCLVNNVRNFHSLRLPLRTLNFRYPKGNISSPKRSFTLYPSRRQTAKEVNLNVANNVVLFKHENSRYFRTLSLLALGQFLLFFGVGYSLLPILPGRKNNQPLLNYIMNAKLPVAVVVTPMLCGLLGPYLMCTFIGRSIRYIILNKGGEKVTVVTYNVFKKSPQFTVPIDKVSVNKSRTELNKYMSIKFEGKPLYYVIHKEGTFVNPELFDSSIAFKKRGSSK
ncbi:transmembrane protein 223 [Chelonus insularis]|uniref:transmembrane protein 223 n=1 Tax=Chelonus insularis TaxID=460826 RepID=UPI00158AC3C5|nr:transmembrane protein 223 [Chelonus insularis]